MGFVCKTALKIANNNLHIVCSPPLRNPLPYSTIFNGPSCSSVALAAGAGPLLVDVAAADAAAGAGALMFNFSRSRSSCGSHGFLSVLFSKQAARHRQRHRRA